MKHIKRNQLLLISSLFLLIILACVVHAFSITHNADFGPLNGTFQDYNPIRRLLNGQVPYRDFTDYLGLGHLYLGTITTLLFGKTFFASKAAFAFLPLFSLALISLCLGRSVVGTFRASMIFTGLIIGLLLIRPVILHSFALTEEVQSAFEYTLKNGNSARMIRCLVLPLFGLLVLAAYFFLEKRENKKPKPLKK